MKNKNFKENLINKYISGIYGSELIDNFDNILEAMEDFNISIYPCINFIKHDQLNDDQKDSLLKIIIRKITCVDELSYVIETMGDYEMDLKSSTLLEFISSFKNKIKSRDKSLKDAQSMKINKIHAAVANNYFDDQIVEAALNNKNTGEDTLNLILHSVSNLKLIEKAFRHPNLTLELALCFIPNFAETKVFDFIVEKVKKHQAAKILQ